MPVMLPPEKKWLVYVVPTTHTDIGYTDLQDRVKVRHDFTPPTLVVRLS